MAEKVNIASLTIDIDDVIKESIRLKTQLDGLKKEQKELAKMGRTSDEAFIQNEITIKKLSKAYRDNQKFAVALESANSDLVKTMDAENKSRQELYDSRRELNVISSQIIGDTKEEIKLRDDINVAIDKQTQKIKELAPGYVEQKEQIGAYKDGILEAIKALKAEKNNLTQVKAELEANKDSVDEGTKEYEEFSLALIKVDKDLEKVESELSNNTQEFKNLDISITGFIENSKEGGNATQYLTNGLKGAKNGMIALTRSAVAFIATPLGILLTTIAGAFLLIKNAMNRSEEATGKIKVAFSSFTGILNSFRKLLEPVGNFLIDVFAVGLEKIADLFGELNPEIKESIKNNRELAKAELELDKTRRLSRKTTLDYQKDIEKLRQLRDDESDRTEEGIKKRIEFNNEIGKLLDKQTQEELKLANVALKVADLRIKSEGETKDALDQRAEALTEISDIEERIIGQAAEQKIERVALEKELNELIVSNKEKALEAFEAEAEARDMTLKESLELEREIASRRKNILDDELKFGLKNKNEYASELRIINAELKKSEKELLEESKKEEIKAAKERKDALKVLAEERVKNAKLEVVNYINQNRSKLNDDRLLNEESLKHETERINLILEKEKEFQKKRLDEGIASKEEYNAKIIELETLNREELAELNKEFDEAEKVRKSIDLQNNLEIIKLNGQLEFENKLQELERNRLAEVEAAEKTGADVELINEKYAAKKILLDESIKAAQLGGFEQVFGAYRELLGEQTILGKTAAIAQTTITTYKAAVEAYSALAGIPIIGPGLGIAASTAAVGLGLKSVNKILGTPVKLATGGMVQGSGHGTSDSIPALLSNGESVNNANSTRMFAPIYSHLNQLGGGKPYKLASGGIAGSTSFNDSQLIDYDLLAVRISEANQNLPQPVLSVEEFKSVENGIEIVENIAND